VALKGLMMSNSFFSLSDSRFADFESDDDTEEDEELS
jgi:hypothetical protein